MSIPRTLQRHHRVVTFLPPDTDAWLIERARKTGRNVMQIATDIIVAEHARQVAAQPEIKAKEIA